MEPRRPMKNVARERLQEELRHLPVLVRELEQQRDGLAQQQTTEDPAGRGIVEYELEQKRQAQAFHAQLRARLNENIVVMKHLKKLIDQHLGPDLFSSFLDDIQIGYHMTDTIVDTTSWDNETDPQAWRINTRTSHHDGHSLAGVELQIQFRNPSVQFVPEVGEPRSWAFLSQYFHVTPLKIDELAVQERSFAARYHRVYSHCNRDVRVYVNLMMRRFVESRREVRVWRSKIMGENEHEVNRDTFVDVVGWVIIQPADEGIVIRTCAHLVPRFVETEATATSEHFPHVGDLASYVLRSLQMDISHVNSELVRT